MDSPILFLVTGADSITACNPVLKRERYIEYMISLHKIFNYSYPVIGVLSEIDEENNIDCPPFKSFPFQTLIKMNKGELDGYNKSLREGISINRLIHNISSINDNTFIIKVSGRYLIIDDTFITTVSQHVTNHDVVAIIRSAENFTAQYTFLYALRYRYFKLFYERYTHPVHDNTSVEYILFDFLKQNQLIEHTIMVDKLGILTNINNEGTFQIF